MTEMHEWHQPGKWETFELPEALAKVEVPLLKAGAIALEQEQVYLLTIWEIEGRPMWQKKAISDRFSDFNMATWVEILNQIRDFLINQMHNTP